MGGEVNRRIQNWSEFCQIVKETLGGEIPEQQLIQFVENLS